MTLDEIKQDKKYWQRLLRLAGYYKGGIDGIRGKLQIAAEQEWQQSVDKAKAKWGTFDTRTESNLSTLIPEVQNATRYWLREKVLPWATAHGYTVKVIQGTRSYAEQDALYAKGRTKPGSKVTNARGGYSNHNFGVAFDIGMFCGATYIEEDKPYRELYKACGSPAGCLWGGNWTSVPDSPHWQLAKYGSGTASIRSIF